MEAPHSVPATIWLEVHQREISLTRIVKALTDPLLRYFPLSPGLGPPKRWSRTNDFRDGLMVDLPAIPPEDETRCAHIRQSLENDLQRQLQDIAERARRATSENIIKLRIIENFIQHKLKNLPNARLDMREYAKIVIESRVKKMLDDDVTSKRLVVSHIGGKAMAGLDSLVEWAVFRHIRIEQEAMPGCPSLVEAAYARLHQRWSTVMAGAPEDTAIKSPDAAQPASRAKREWDDHELRRLWDKSKEPGMTHQKLAEVYGVSRQSITKTLEKAKTRFGPQKAGPFDPLRHGNRKK